MDGPLINGNFVQTTRSPHNGSASPAAVPLNTNYQAIVPTGQCPYYNPDFWFPGRLIHFRHVFQCTSVATPGAFEVNILMGPNLSAQGVSISSAGVTWTANNANTLSVVEFWIRCMGLGSSGLLLGYGSLFVGGTGLLPIPWNTVGTTTMDLTQGGYIAPQYARSGSTAETITHHDIIYRTLN